jgi:hypothetical protein
MCEIWVDHCGECGYGNDGRCDDTYSHIYDVYLWSVSIPNTARLNQVVNKLFPSNRGLKWMSHGRHLVVWHSTKTLPNPNKNSYFSNVCFKMSFQDLKLIVAAVFPHLIISRFRHVFITRIENCRVLR